MKINFLGKIFSIENNFLGKSFSLQPNTALVLMIRSAFGNFVELFSSICAFLCFGTGEIGQDYLWIMK